MVNRFIDRQRLLALQPLAQRLPFYVWHHVIEKARCLPAVVQRKDVRMIEARGKLDFAKKTLRSQRSRQIGMENLERYNAIVLAVLRQIYRRHATAPELAVDGVRVRE